MWLFKLCNEDGVWQELKNLDSSEQKSGAHTFG